MNKERLIKYSAFITSFLIIGIIFAIPLLTLADSANEGLNIKFEPPVKFNSFEDLLKGALDVLLQISIPVIAGFIVWSGFLFLKAQGNPSELEKARKTLLFTIAGAGVIFGSWVIAKLIVATVKAFQSDAGV